MIAGHDGREMFCGEHHHGLRYLPVPGGVVVFQDHAATFVPGCRLEYDQRAEGRRDAHLVAEPADPDDGTKMRVKISRSRGSDVPEELAARISALSDAMGAFFARLDPQPTSKVIGAVCTHWAAFAAMVSEVELEKFVEGAKIAWQTVADGLRKSAPIKA